MLRSPGGSYENDAPQFANGSLFSLRDWRIIQMIKCFDREQALINKCHGSTHIADPRLRDTNRAALSKERVAAKAAI
jgi:hypothetical protein